MMETSVELDSHGIGGTRVGPLRSDCSIAVLLSNEGFCKAWPAELFRVEAGETQKTRSIIRVVAVKAVLVMSRYPTLKHKWTERSRVCDCDR
jgi:hypothetical protein